MIPEIIIAGFIGGLFRGLVGYISHERKGALFLMLLIFGLVGAVCGTSAIVFIIADAPWKVFLMSGLAGYVGADIINSFFAILHKKGVDA